MTRETLIEAWQNYRRWDNELREVPFDVMVKQTTNSIDWIVAMAEDYANENGLDADDVLWALNTGEL